jgi:putative transposase
VRGLSDRDIEAALAEVLGVEAALSKSTVGRICQKIREGVRGVAALRSGRGAAGGPVSGRQPLQDAPGRPGRAGLVRLGIDVDGKPVLVGLAPAASESDAWDDVLADLT